MVNKNSEIISAATKAWPIALILHIISFCILDKKTVAQIVPDNTLPTNSITNPGCLICGITGGTIRGNNLFHSFNTFSVPTNGSALFLNNPNITNIITRITGNASSQINGLISTQGKSNLFFINANGISVGSLG